MPLPAPSEPARAQPGEQTKFCDKCQADRPLPGGVQRTQKSWHCGHCWRNYSMRRKF